MNNKNYIEKDKDWFLLLNPIRLFKNNSENKPTSTDIQPLE